MDLRGRPRPVIILKPTTPKISGNTMAPIIHPLMYAGEAFGGKYMPKQADVANAIPTQSKIEPTKIRAAFLIKSINERMAVVSRGAVAYSNIHYRLCGFCGLEGGEIACHPRTNRTVPN